MTKTTRAIKSSTVLASFLAAAFSLQAFQAKPGEEKCSIEGRVLSSVTGAPLRGVTLYLLGTARVTAAGGEDGRFAFPGLVAGRYRLIAQRAGYLPQGYGAQAGSTSGGDGVDLTIGQQMKDVLIKMVPAAVISGRVLDESGEPAGEMVVEAFRSRYQRGVRQWVSIVAVRTNDLGEFRIATLAAGRYLVAAGKEVSVTDTVLGAQPAGDKPERQYVRTFFPNVTDVAGAQPVQVAAGEESSGTEVHLQKVNTVRIRGKVIGGRETGTVLVQLIPKGLTEIKLASVQPKLVLFRGKEGVFDLQGVVPGVYLLGAGFIDGQTLFFDSLLLQVGEQHIDGLTLQPVAAPELTGAVVVVDKAPVKLNNVQIRLEPADYLAAGAGSASATAGEDGAFTLRRIQPSLCRVQVGNLPEGAYVKSVRYGEREVGEEGIDLSRGVSGSLQVTLSLAAAQVDGVVQGADDKPIGEATVVLAPDSRQYSLFMEARTDEKGRYLFKGVTPGNYKILAWSNIEPGAYQDPDVLKRFESQAKALSLKEGDRKSLPLKVIPSN